MAKASIGSATPVARRRATAATQRYFDSQSPAYGFGTTFTLTGISATNRFPAEVILSFTFATGVSAATFGAMIVMANLS